ncbi:MAG: EAL domain-containing protein [Oscillospiraceae bacterium]
MSVLKTVLIVDDHAVNRAILTNILSKEYAVLEADNGQTALALLAAHGDDIIAIMLDLQMPIMDGYAVLAAIQKDDRCSNLPIIVMTENGNPDTEIKALTLGAWDFVSKPYNPDIILFRLRNAIDRSQLSALRELKYLSEYDALTGIYNKAKFFAVTRELLDAHPEEPFAFLRFDVDRFQLINSFFGTAEGDKLLIYIAEHMAQDLVRYPTATYGRIESDVMGICLPYQQTALEDLLCSSKDTLAKFNPNYDIVPSIGIYVIDDPSISVEEMYNRATLAAKTCKGNYVDFYAYYNESMSAALAVEQDITNDMNSALKSGQFQIYLQPKYNLHTSLPCGAEALVRWIHPTKGLLSPAEFIPVFERNGFITKLDYYVWEQACQCLHKWKLQGVVPAPLSVNISRVNLYNPNLVETLVDLVERYDVEPALLNLELTETAYTDNPTSMKKTMEQFHRHGFTLLMDDFGSGYSSLSLLKDIAIDILKIDMGFLTETDMPGRGENIIASVIRMAKWLNIPVIAEGAETAEQVEFLRSVGCDFVQGYYFAKPMPVEDYETLCAKLARVTKTMPGSATDSYRYDDLFTFNEEMKLIFENALQPAVIYEFVDNKIELIRVNEAYYALLGHEEMVGQTSDFFQSVSEECRTTLLSAFRACVATEKPTECEYLRRRSSGVPVWLYTKLRYVSTVGGKHIIIGELTDITVRKEIDSELQKYRASLLSGTSDSHTVLIVDDVALNRTILKHILQDRFNFMEAGNGAEAIEVLRSHPDEIDLILLDIGMPVMNGREFLAYKKKSPDLDGIPVIMITADDSPQQQVSTFSLGASDYIVKPFIPEVVVRRVQNVLDSNHRFKEMVREYNNMSEQVKTDLMTGLINRFSAEEMIEKRLEAAAGTCIMVMLDIDHFKVLNDTMGHAFGDKAVRLVAETLRNSFRQDDIVARMGGDEFAIFMEGIPEIDRVVSKLRNLCGNIEKLRIEGTDWSMSCSFGVAVSDEQTHTFQTLYQHADEALYRAKSHGRNTVLVYGREATLEGSDGHETTSFSTSNGS